MGVKDWIEDAKTRIEGLECPDVERERSEGEALLIDIRDVRERWREGSIPGARNVPRGMLEFWADPESEYYKDYMDPRRRTIVFCAGGQRSALAADTLQRLGYEDVAHLESGFNRWKKERFPVEEIPRK